MYTHIVVDRDMVHALATKTGLSTFAITDLLVKGWRYVENAGEIARWEHPMWSLTNRQTEGVISHEAQV